MASGSKSGFRVLRSKILKKAHVAIEVLREDGLIGLARKVNRDVGIVIPYGVPTGRLCLTPYTSLFVTAGGGTYLCCPDWVKFRLGVLSKQTTLLDLWNNRMARTFRAAMLGTQLSRVCKGAVCPEILADRLPRFCDGRVEFDGECEALDTVARDEDAQRAIERGQTKLDYGPKAINLGVDSRCNLRCPSCRSGTTTTLPKHEEECLDLVLANLERLAPSLKKLELLGSGEVFYSPFGLQLLRSLNRSRFPLLQVHLITNGILCNERNWESLGAGADLIKMIGVSIDAATPDTYRQVRVGANWDILMRNLEFLRSLRNRGVLLRTGINFVISARNFREIPDFIRMGQRFEVDHCMFLLFQRWPDATTNEEYQELAVHLPGHPLHAEYRRVLEDPICRSPGVRLPSHSQFE